MSAPSPLRQLLHSIGPVIHILIFFPFFLHVKSKGIYSTILHMHFCELAASPGQVYVQLGL